MVAHAPPTKRRKIIDPKLSEQAAARLLADLEAAGPEQLLAEAERLLNLSEPAFAPAISALCAARELARARGGRITLRIVEISGTFAIKGDLEIGGTNHGATRPPTTDSADA